MPAELVRRFERRSRTYEARTLPTELHQPNKNGAEDGTCTRVTGQAIRGTSYCTNSAWSEQRELNSRHWVGGPRHRPLYHTRPSKTFFSNMLRTLGTDAPCPCQRLVIFSTL